MICQVLKKYFDSMRLSRARSLGCLLPIDMRTGWLNVCSSGLYAVNDCTWFVFFDNYSYSHNLETLASNDLYLSSWEFRHEVRE